MALRPSTPTTASDSSSIPSTTSSIGRTSSAAATSPPWKHPTCSSATCARSSADSADTGFAAPALAGGAKLSAGHGTFDPRKRIERQPEDHSVEGCIQFAAGGLRLGETIEDADRTAMPALA